MSVIGIDIGTTSICALEMDPGSSRIFRIEKRSNVFLEEALYSQDPERIVAVVQDLLEVLWNDRVTDIAISSQMHGILFVDARGRAVTPFHTWKNPWGRQLRCRKTYAEEMAESASYAALSGHGCVTALYMQDHGLIPKTAVSLYNIGDYVAMRLTGMLSTQMNVTLAESIGCFHRETADFKRDVLKRLGLNPDWFPQVTVKDRVCGYYRGAWVHGAFGDNQCSFLGSVENCRESVCINVGTGQQVSCYHPERISAGGVDVRSFFDLGFLYVGVSQNGGKNYERFVRFLESAVELYTGVQVDGFQKTWEIWQSRKAGHSVQITPALYSDIGSVAAGTVLAEDIPESLDAADVIDGYVRGMARELYTLYQRIPEAVRREKTKFFAAGNGIVKNRILWQCAQELFHTRLCTEMREEAAAAGAAIYISMEGI